ncbi:MAG: hypothetical protein GC171_12180 [Terrimonas sp.]|nr:hypothetical protein [Terrimonas sp.]
MKKYLWIGLIFLNSIPLEAQRIRAGKKDTLMPVLSVPVAKNKIIVRPVLTRDEIAFLLDSLLGHYVSSPNTESTLKQIRIGASNILTAYWRKGKLQGSKAAEAYYVKIGNDTMNANDLLNHKMILVTGIASLKPAEFEVLRFEKSNTFQ